jgi:hypothetical protein
MDSCRGTTTRFFFLFMNLLGVAWLPSFLGLFIILSFLLFHGLVIVIVVFIFVFGKMIIVSSREEPPGSSLSCCSSRCSSSRRLVVVVVVVVPQAVVAEGVAVTTMVKGRTKASSVKGLCFVVASWKP